MYSSSHKHSQKSTGHALQSSDFRGDKNHKMTKRVLSVACSLLILLASLSQAQDYPTKPVRLVAPFSTGAMQILAHILSENLAPLLGQPVVVDYRPGAAGNLGLEIAAKAPPD